ncbi:hypothetical protein ABO55_005029 [Salmonella enterica subsp. enterica]|nr:hypothetical protein [Salmonella enterica subsp. enterica serovar Abony]
MLTRCLTADFTFLHLSSLILNKSPLLNLPIAIIHWSVTVFSSSVFYWQYSPSRVKLHPCPLTPSGSRS